MEKEIILINNQLIGINQSLNGILYFAQHNSFWNSQLFGTLIGASIGLIPFLYLIYKDRPIIKVEAQYSIFGMTGQLVNDGISIKIFNKGRRDILLESFFFEFSDREKLVFTSDSSFIGGSGLPRKLEGGSSHTVYILSGELSSPFFKKQDYPIYACYNSALNKKYKCSIKRKFWDCLFKK